MSTQVRSSISCITCEMNLVIVFSNVTQLCTATISDDCSESPTCTGDTQTISDTTAVDTDLFTIQGQQDPNSIGSLSYSFTSPTPAYFKIDQLSGKYNSSKYCITLSSYNIGITHSCFSCCNICPVRTRGP